MTISELSDFFARLEKTASRNQMTEILAELFKKSSSAEIDKICYLSLGGLAPRFAGLEFNLAERLMYQVLAAAYGKETKEVQTLYKKLGDLGDVAYELVGTKKQKNRKTEKLSVEEVYRRLYDVATEAGEGSVERKISQMARLLADLDPESARFVARIPVGLLRLGFSDITILDVLSLMVKGDKSARPEIERAYNVSADIGKIAQTVKKKGLAGLAKISVQPGTPIRPSLAERLPSAEKIIEKVGPEVAVEAKFDGFRSMVHIWPERGKKKVAIFSRNLEDTTQMYPEIVAAAKKLPVKSAILDGEAIGYNPDTGEFLPFQETVQRKRKYGIEEKAKELPLKVFVFDLLYIDGKTLLDKPFAERRKRLEKLLAKRGDSIALAEQIKTSDPEELKSKLDYYVSEGLEGLVAKMLDAPYRAGARSFHWVKYKRTTEGELADTVDCLVMGAYRGRGKRAEFGVGAFLVGVLDQKRGKFVTISKIGTGLTDEQWRELNQRSKKLEVKVKPKEYEVDKNLSPDLWLKPSLVVEIMADEITRSPIHTAGAGKEDKGYALRFPRLVRFRDEKSPDQATTVKEVEKLFKMQGRRNRVNQVNRVN